MMNPTGILEEVNDLIIEANFELSDDEVLRDLGFNGYPSHDEIRAIQSDLHLVLTDKRKNRLEQYQKSYKESMVADRQATYSTSRKKSINEMIIDIASAIGGNSDDIPKGVLLAFREQNEKSEVDEKDIIEIWEDLVTLGLINEDSDKSD